MPPRVDQPTMEEIIITTLLPPTGETGVRTHSNEFSRYLRGEHRPARLNSTYDVNRWLRRVHTNSIVHPRYGGTSSTRLNETVRARPFPTAHGNISFSAKG